MKYRLKKDLPFMKAETIFKKAASLGCGVGWAIPAKPKAQGQTADNPVTVFSDHENHLLDDINDDINWIEQIPETTAEKLEHYEQGKWTREEFLRSI